MNKREILPVIEYPLECPRCMICIGYTYCSKAGCVFRCSAAQYCGGNCSDDSVFCPYYRNVENTQKAT